MTYTHAGRPSLFRARTAAVTAALLAASALVGSPGVAVGAETAGVPRDGLMTEYLFSQREGAEVGNSASSDVGPATVVNPADTQWTGTSLALTGGAKDSAANWVQLPADLLAGQNSATITTEVKAAPESLTAWHFLWNIGSDSTDAYYFASLKDMPRTAITTGGSSGEQNARATSPLVPDRWYSITSVIDGDASTLALYVDGELASTTKTELKPASITEQTLNAIGRSPYPDPMFAGEVASFRVYDRALAASDIKAIADADAAPHAADFAAAAQDVLDAISPLTLDDTTTVLPSPRGAEVRWASTSPDVLIHEDGRTATVRQPAAGEEPVQATLTATTSVRGETASREVSVTIAPAVQASDDYGYLMVHFIEDSEGYAEKIYLDVSRGDNAEQWDPLNGGKPILASQLGTTGVRDPFLTRNPETGTYYIIATDLRVFGGDNGTGDCTSWCHWTTNGSTKFIVWESDDLVHWGEPRSFDTALNSAGEKTAELGMAWAPEALWVDNYYPDGRGAFVMYWSANVYDDAAHTGASYNRVVWGATTDFTQETYAFGGDFVNAGANTIDTTMIQNDGTTYRMTKDNGQGKGIYMESTTAERWWEAGTEWTTLQTEIGADWAGGNPGGVEGPAVFKSHSDEKWYLYVDVIPSTGYRPMVTTDLDAGWTQLQDESFYMAPSTKHGGVVSLTKAEYDQVRAADATAATLTEPATAEVSIDADAQAVAEALPATAEVTLAYGRGIAVQPVQWDAASVDTSVPGTYKVTGVVQTLGANLNTWTGAAGSTDWNAPDRVLGSSTALTVTAQITVTQAAPQVTASVVSRCVAHRVVHAVTVRNISGEQLDITVATPYAEAASSLRAGKHVTTKLSSGERAVDAGTVTVRSAAAAGEAAAAELTVPYAATTCR